MNEILKIKSKGLPDISVPQLPLPIGLNPPLKSYPPEFWLEIATDRQHEMIEELEKKALEYIVYDVEDSFPLKSVVVCRSWLPYIEMERIVMDICNTFFIGRFVVSDGSLSTVSADGDLKGFVSFD